MITRYRKRLPPLGENQLHMLRSLVERGSWFKGTWWLWMTPSDTRRLLDSLCRRGLAQLRDGTYTASEAGRRQVAGPCRD